MRHQAAAADLHVDDAHRAAIAAHAVAAIAVNRREVIRVIRIRREKAPGLMDQWPEIRVSGVAEKQTHIGHRHRGKILPVDLLTQQRVARFRHHAHHFFAERQQGFD